MRLTRKMILLPLLLMVVSFTAFAQNSGADEQIIGWSPDGTQLAIFSNRTGQPELYLIDTNGNIVQHLLQNQMIWAAEWSSAGQLAVLSSNPEDEAVSELDLYLASLNGGEDMFVTRIPMTYVGRMVWSPDNRFIALSSDNTILVVDTADGSIQTVGNQFYYPRLEWSPNSQHIAVVSIEGETNQTESVIVYTVATQTRSGNLLATYWKREIACCLSWVSWSPDSAQVAIAVMYDANIYISDIATETLVPVAHTGGSITALQWSMDGSSIYYHLDWRTPDEMIPQEQLEGGRGEGIYRATIADGTITPVSTALQRAFSVDFAATRSAFVFRSMDAMGSREFLTIGSLADGSIHPLQMDFFKSMGWAWSPDVTQLAVSLCESTDGDSDIYIVDVSNGALVNITLDDAFTGEAIPSNCMGLG